MDFDHYDNASHYALFHSWWGARHPSVQPRDEMPAVGFVVYEDKLPVAMAFLRQVEGAYGQMDGLVTNPSASAELRNDAIDRAVELVIAAAKVMGLKGLLAYSMDKNTLERSVKHGFVPAPYTLIAVNLEDSD